MNIHALCICRAPTFLCRGGVVMERALHLQRLGVGGNFFHTLGSKTFFVCSVFVPTSFIGFVTIIPSASTMHPPKKHRRHRLSQEPLPQNSFKRIRPNSKRIAKLYCVWVIVHRCFNCILVNFRCIISPNFNAKFFKCDSSA